MKTLVPTDRLDHVAWARRVNARWIVRGGLNDSATAYMNHLERIHPERLVRSCRRAHRLVYSMEPLEDPKPWFYGGLFSLATTAEARRFLAEHPFILATIPSLAFDPDLPDVLVSAAPETARKIQRLKNALARLA